ncbi:MAG TPA: hypothetical protein DD990_31475 [Cyanobacteria bacterium UBA11368]|nr:hypothetical protein [Cyanobacteria bacterium UBA11368]
MTQGTISLWKKGAIKTTPSQTALMSFANFMGITVDDLAVQIGINIYHKSVLTRSL